MPAVVVAVLVVAGQEVEKGAPLVVLSAMKTETQMVAPYPCRVTSVSTLVGARVRPGEILVQIERAGEGGDRDR